MNLFTLLRDAGFFYSRHLGFILSLCLPLILLESLTRQLLEHWGNPQGLPIQDLIAGLLFYPLYTAALILFLEARSQGLQPSRRLLLAQAFQRWLPLAVLVGFTSSLIMLGGALYILPGIWVMVKTALSEYLLVERGLSPLEALRDSFILTRRRFWLIFGGVLTTLVPLMAAEYALSSQLPQQESLGLRLLVDGLLGMLQLFSTVVFFRLYMLIVPPVSPR